MPFRTRRLGVDPDVIAPDGSNVRLLLDCPSGSMAHFELPPGRVSKAVAHRTVEEIWYIIEGTGEMWRADDDGEEVVPVEPGVCLDIPVGTRFQFRTTGDTSLCAVAITMPCWPGMDEAYFVDGAWESTEA